ncbi:MAG: glycosyltransferase [candidate division KSB1 bacterium]|nr:glycosyltransferase [candidate division KSB1 bacterium]
MIRLCADKIIAHSPGLISRLHLTQRQIQNKVIYFRYFSAIEKEILSRSDPNVIEYDIIFAGRVSLKKGVLDLLQAIAYLTSKMPNLKAAIVGMFAKEDEPVIKNFVAENKLENHVIFTGFVPDVYEYILKSKIVVLPTHRDYFPMILLESMLLERPIIATAVGDIPTLIAHGKNGLLVEPGNISQLADMIEKILDEKEYARFKVGVQLTKEQILAQTNDYQVIKKIIDQHK